MRSALLLFLTVVAVHAGDIRVLTFNIRFDRPDPEEKNWSHRRDAAAAVIKNQADIAGLQEVLPNQRQDLVERCPEFGFVGIGREPDDKGEGSPIFYRKERFEVSESGTVWLSDTPDQPGSKSWGNKIPRIFTWAKVTDRTDSRTFFVFNAHLDHESQPSRERSCAYIAEQIQKRAGTTPALLIGDFNISEENPAFLSITKEPLNWTSMYTALGQPASATFHGFKGESKYGAIDFIFFNPEAWVPKSINIDHSPIAEPATPKAYPSDHFPVAGVIALKPQP